MAGVTNADQKNARAPWLCGKTSFSPEPLSHFIKFEPTQIWGKALPVETDRSASSDPGTQSIGERIITEIPVIILNEPAKLKVYAYPSVVSLTVKGGVDYIANIDASNINVSIDFLQWRPSQAYYEPTVEVPKDILGFSDLSPKNIELVVTRARE